MLKSATFCGPWSAFGALSDARTLRDNSLCGRPSTFARSGADFVADIALSQGQVQISWQAQRSHAFRKIDGYIDMYTLAACLASIKATLVVGSRETTNQILTLISRNRSLPSFLGCPKVGLGRASFQFVAVLQNSS